MLSVIISGPDGERVSQFEADEIVLGRIGTVTLDDRSVTLNDRKVSKRHARLRRKTDGWYVEDLRSTNGTFVNGVRIVSACRIKVGDKLKLGSTKITIANVARPTTSSEPTGSEPQRPPAASSDPASLLSPGFAFLPTAAPLPPAIDRAVEANARIVDAFRQPPAQTKAEARARKEEKLRKRRERRRTSPVER